ncbi:MAG: DHH family phosphoesterase [bacterium]
MTYKEFLKKESAGLAMTEVLDRINAASSGTALVYTHDDPDGLTAGIILKRFLESRNIRVVMKIPTVMELEKERLARDVAGLKPDIVFVVDKATMGYYDEYAQIHSNIIVIDHHPLLGQELKKILVVNPVLGGYKRCSASFVAHMLAASAGFSGAALDIASLIGLKGDWAVEPATEDISDYVRPFYDEVKEKYRWLFRHISSRPTMFEVKQREKTTLLNQIAEIVFALGGGGFQYFYNGRDGELKDITTGEFAFKNLEGWLSKYKEVSTEEDFIKALPEAAKASKIFGYYLSDWNCTMELMKNSIFAATAKDTDIYLFMGSNVKLMPMAGSVALYRLPAASSDTLFIMVSEMGESGVHFSFRSRNGKIHCGNFAHDLALSMQKKFQSDKITGGGHPFAAECRTRQRLPFHAVMTEFFDVFGKITKE